GALASGLSGKGRFPEPDAIVETLICVLATNHDLRGEHVLVTSGPTREPIDPVRYLSNRSSGKMGHAIATASLRRGARVTLVAGPTHLSPPPGAVYVPVETAEDMREAVLQHLDAATIVIKAAAVADYRVSRPSPTKIKSRKDEGLTLELAPNPDILKEVAARRGSRFTVGFPAETDDVSAHAAAKLAAKGVDLLVVNDVSKRGIGFESDENELMLLDRWGGTVDLPRTSKLEVANAILDRVLSLRAADTSAPAARQRAPHCPMEPPRHAVAGGREESDARVRAVSGKGRSRAGRPRMGERQSRRRGARSKGARAAGSPRADRPSCSDREIPARGCWSSARDRERKRTSKANRSWAAPG